MGFVFCFLNEFCVLNIFFELNRIVWFNEKIEGSYASVTVLDSNKKSITENNPEVVLDDPKSVVLNIPQMEPGRYTVQYRVMSVDGHVIASSYDFSIKN